MSDPYGCSTGRHFYPEKCSCVFETQAHHLQRTELEALRAENAALLEYIDEAKKALGGRRVSGEPLRTSIADLLDGFAEIKTDRAALCAEVSRLTKERYARCTVDECNEVDADVSTLKARVQELEGALKDARGCLSLTARYGAKANSEGYDVILARIDAALESGTGPIDPIGPIEKPIAPAPKTFTVEDLSESCRHCGRRGRTSNAQHIVDGEPTQEPDEEPERHWRAGMP